MDAAKEDIHKMVLGPPAVIFIVGAPGAGKGTLCKKLIERVGFYHISTGDYLRELCTSSNEVAAKALEGVDMTLEQLRAYLADRKLIPPEYLMRLLKNKIYQETMERARRIPREEVKFLIDGFPRQVEGAKGFESQVAIPEMIVTIHCMKVQAKERFVARARDLGDDEAVFEKRFAEYRENMEAISEHYRGRVKTSTVNNSRSVREAFEELLKDFGIEY